MDIIRKILDIILEFLNQRKESKAEEQAKDRIEVELEEKKEKIRKRKPKPKSTEDNFFGD